jgi:hypothetical protein
MAAKSRRYKRKLLRLNPIKGIAKGATSAVEKIKDFSEDVSDAASRKIRGLVREFNAAIPAMKALGFSVSAFSVEVGIAPDIGATLKGSVRALNPRKIRKLIGKYSDNVPLSALLKALLIAAELKDELSDMGIKGVEIDIELGLPPLINVDLLT